MVLVESYHISVIQGSASNTGSFVSRVRLSSRYPIVPIPVTPLLVVAQKSFPVTGGL